MASLDGRVQCKRLENIMRSIDFTNHAAAESSES
jgi:hypothetical protein